MSATADPSSQLIRILVVDDHPLVRLGVLATLEQDPQMAVVGEAADGEEACARAAELVPDVIVMDLGLPRVNGVDATRRILASDARARVLALTALHESRHVREFLSVGGRGYLLKRTIATDLNRAIRVVFSGGVFLDPELSKRPQEIDTPPLAVLASELTAREVDVASLAARGYSNAEVGSALHISVKTVETHKARIMSKLGITTRAELVRYAVYRGWLSS